MAFYGTALPSTAAQQACHQIVHTYSVFPSDLNVTMRLPRTRKHCVAAPAHEDDLERTETLIFVSWFWVQLTYGVQIDCNSEAKEEEQEKKYLGQKKMPPLSFAFLPLSI